MNNMKSLQMKNVKLFDLEIFDPKKQFISWESFKCTSYDIVNYVNLVRNSVKGDLGFIENKKVNKTIESMINTGVLVGGKKIPLLISRGNKGGNQEIETYEFKGNSAREDILLVFARVDKTNEILKKIIKRMIDLEELVKNNLNFKETRQLGKDQNKLVNNAIKEYYLEYKHSNTIPAYAYSNEARLIFKILTKTNHKEFREMNNIQDDESVRDYLNEAQLYLLRRLENRDEIYLEDGLCYEARKVKLTEFYNKELNKLALKGVKYLNVSL